MKLIIWVSFCNSSYYYYYYYDYCYQSNGGLNGRHSRPPPPPCLCQYVSSIHCMQLSIIINIIDGWMDWIESVSQLAKSCHQPKTRCVAGRAESLNYDSSFWIALLLNVYQSCCCCWSDDQSRLPPAAIDPPSHHHHQHDQRQQHHHWICIHLNPWPGWQAIAHSWPWPTVFV